MSSFNNLERMHELCALKKPFITETLTPVNAKSPTKQSEPLCGKKRGAGLVLFYCSTCGNLETPCISREGAKQIAMTSMD